VAGAKACVAAGLPRLCTPIRGPVRIAVPRDRPGTFEPVVVPRPARRVVVQRGNPERVRQPVITCSVSTGHSCTLSLAELPKCSELCL
jgi:hypothetical protein